MSLYREPQEVQQALIFGLVSTVQTSSSTKTQAQVWDHPTFLQLTPKWFSLSGLAMLSTAFGLAGLGAKALRLTMYLSMNNTD